MTGLPRLGIRLHGGLDPRRCVALAKKAESTGFAAVWFAENPFGRGVLPAAAACAAATERLRIGIGVFNPFNRHPTLIAMEIAALDELASGRAALGIGSGIASAVERMGLEYDRPLAAVRDAVHIVRAMLCGETVEYDGRVFPVRGARLDFAPHRADVPLFLAARGEQALRLCGRIADGLMISNVCPPGFAAHAAEAVREAARAAGRPPPADIVQYVPCAVGRDAAEARRMAKAALAAIAPGYWALGERFPAARAALLCDTGIAESEFAAAIARLEAGESGDVVLDDRFVTAFAIAGTADECLSQAAVYGKAGVTELGLTVLGDDPVESVAALAAARADPG